MKKTILSSLMGAAILAMGNATAGGGSLFGDSGESSMADGIYVGGSYGQANTRCMLLYKSEDKDCATGGWKTFAGYKFTENLAIEGTYYKLGKAEETYKHAILGDVEGTGEASGLGLSGLYAFEIFDNFDVFGKLGMMRWDLEGTAKNSSIGTKSPSQSGTSMIYGAGASYKITDSIALRGEYERFAAEYQNDLSDSTKTKESNVDVLSAGVTFSTF